MEDPVQEIPTVIHLLTQSPPSLQRATIEKYFTPDAAFSHPFCRTWSRPNSRWLVQRTYRWYKIMSPRIDLTVQSVAYDEKNLILYVTIFQIFRIWAVPFYYAPVRLTTVLYLRRSGAPVSYADIAASPSPSTLAASAESKPKPNHSLLADLTSQNSTQPPTTATSSKPLYHIAKQDDLYQVDQWIRFVAPGAWMLIWLWQVWATVFCVAGTVLLWPVTWVEENWGWGSVGVEKGGKMRVEGEKTGGMGKEVNGDGLAEGEVVRRSGARGRVVG